MNGRPTFTAAVAAALLATACAGLPPARLALPADLFATPALDLAGIPGTREGRAVGSVELLGGTPRLWRRASTPALQHAIGRAALALALLWDPAG